MGTYPRAQGGGWSAAIFWPSGLIQLVTGPNRGRHFDTEGEAERVGLYMAEHGTDAGAAP